MRRFLFPFFLLLLLSCNGGRDDDGDGWTEDMGDCDDADSSVYPGADEVEDGRDNDCDGKVDEVPSTDDDDGDGWSEGEGDCDDGDPTVYPGAEEVVDGRDNDCDGSVDETGSTENDQDGDGFTEEAGDCNDEDPDINPSADDLPYNGIDEDCDGSDLTDVDEDGYDAEEAGGDDCDDEDYTVHPGAREEMDGSDNDCDGIIDPLEYFDECDPDEPNLWGGYWWTFDDSGAGGTSTISTSISTENYAGDPGGCSLRATGIVTDETSYGEGYIGLGTDFEESGEPRDLSGFNSVVFSLKGDGNRYRVALMMDSVHDYDFHGYEFATSLGWITFRISFSDLEQAGWGTPVTFDPSAIIGVEWVTAESPLSSVDIYLDGIYFDLN